MPTEPEKKQTARGAYKDFVVDYFRRDLGQLSDQQRSLGLMRFYIEQIHNRLRNYLSDDDIEEGLVDGANDLEADIIDRINELRRRERERAQSGDAAATQSPLQR